MASPLTPARRTFDIPNTETGLAEWTSKIKAMQRQVDADEEAEQKRLEEEIAASRRARLRRSRGNTPSDSPNMSRDSDRHNHLSDAPEIDEPKSIPNRQNDALQKIISNNHVFNPDKGSSDTLSTRLPTAKKPESISLAAFMGGRASGPKLNRHAPQQDAHDPTQFDQPDTRAPHPIFGKGGVAMPGMATKSGTRESTPSASSKEDSDRSRQSRGSSASATSSTAQRYANKPSFSESEPHRTPETVITPAATRSMEKESSKPPRDKLPTAKLYVKGQREPEQYAISAHNAGIRERTTSTPPIAAPAGNLGESPTVSARPLGSDAFSRTSNPVAPKYTPMRDRTISTPSYMANEREPMIPKEPRQTLIPQSSRPSTFTPPSLARPILPEARLPSQTPVIPATLVASPAFQRSQLQKDPSPSISRLQGRGFVQNMVKASVQLEQQSGPSPPDKPDKSRPANGGRKSSVLDRWQPGTQSNSSPTSSPMTSPSHRQDAFHSSPVRRFTTTNNKDLPTELPHMQKPVPAPTSLKSVASLPSLLKSGPSTPIEPLTPKTQEIINKMPPEGDLGSATTMFVVKPSKSSTRLPAVDELGVKHTVIPTFGNRKGQFRASLETAASSGKPLIHPTKDRARKPKKYSAQTSSELPQKSSPLSWMQRPAQVAIDDSLPSATLPSSSPSSGGFAINDAPISQKKQPSAEAISKEPISDSKVARATKEWARAAQAKTKEVTDSGNLLAESRLKPSGMLKQPLPGMVLSTARVDEASSPPERSPRSVWAGPVTSNLPQNPHAESRSKPSGMLKQPLLNIAPPTAPFDEANFPQQRSPRLDIARPVASTPMDARDSGAIVNASSKHNRIPSTGNRATVMDVAQALSDHPAVVGRLDVSPTSIVVETASTSVMEPMKSRSTMPAEKRKSSYERYSAVVLPPLKEEATPTSSPSGTLSGISAPSLRNESVNGGADSARVGQAQNVIHINHQDESLPEVDIASLARPQFHTLSLPPDTQTISVDVIVIKGATASTLSQNLDIFYDTETLAVVNRTKSKSTSLASTTVWAWIGKRSHWGEKEEKKLQELAKHYGTSPSLVYQNSEPIELVFALGGRLAVRQGTRTHWTPENTTMHSVRLSHGVILIDEHELNVRNLCSGFSYCLTILDTVYVWHGCGSTDLERKAAIEYAEGLVRTSAPPVELLEGENDTDEMFWMILGDEQFAKADYWQWRKTSPVIDPSIWKVEASRNKHAITPVETFSERSFNQQSAYILDCIWELFVLVGTEARDRRQDIRLAINVAVKLAKRAASERPYKPTVHVLVLPSQLPLDLRLSVRCLDEVFLNNGEVPDHMNLLSSTEASSHLDTYTWDRSALKDEAMLPLGVAVTDIP